ncbi:MAG: TIGR01777 family oxidoreductase [Gemmatimonadetes bacterium]|nr:TIGR01777 family oxidoreductase [Gemmatimonadota bacterium]
MRFAITGSTGLVGSALTRFLRDGGHHVTRVVRAFGGMPASERAVVWHPDEGVIEKDGLEDHDVVIHLAGESIAGVWTDGKKRRIRESRVRGTRLIAETLAGLERRPRTLISASAFDIYGSRPPSEQVDENSEPGSGFLADVIVAWEASTQAASDVGIRVVHTRFGNVLSSEGGMLGVLLPLYRLGLGTKFGDGRQYWPWIAIDDVPPAMLHVLERPEIAGPVNFVAPGQVTNAEFTDAVAAVVGRPSFLKLPAFAAKLAPGGMAEELLLRGSRVVPKKLIESGYAFRHPELRPALKAMLA